MNVIVDCGHGGIDDHGKYTTAPHKMYTFEDGLVAMEGVLNRQIGQRLINILVGDKRFLPIATVDPDDPRDISLRERVRLANEEPDPSVFISIHCNASPSHNARGFEIFTTRGRTKSDRLASAIYHQVDYLYRDSRMRNDYSDGDPDKEANFYVIRKTRMPAVLIECGFFDQRDDFLLLSDPGFQQALAMRIYQGIVKYYEDESRS